METGRQESALGVEQRRKDCSASGEQYRRSNEAQQHHRLLALRRRQAGTENRSGNRREHGNQRARCGEYHRVFAMILTAASALIAVFAPVAASILGPGLPPPQREQAVMLLRLIAPSILFAGGAAIFSALLYTERRFLAPGLHSSCLNLGTIT